MKNKLIYKMTKSMALVFIVVGSMWIGSSIQLYSAVLSQAILPNGYATIWYKLLGFLLFFNVNEYKGTISYLLGNITVASSILLLFLTLALIKINTKYNPNTKNKLDHISGNPGADSSC